MLEFKFDTQLLIEGKDLDEDAIVRTASKTGAVVTAEEHSIIGGLGSAVAECLAEKLPTPMGRVGTKDTFGESGEADELLAKYGLTAADIRRMLKIEYYNPAG